MHRRIVLAALLSLFAAPSLAQDAAQTPPPANPRVRIETSAGAIVIEVEALKAPVTSANFLRYVDQKKFDGTAFYRAMKIGQSGLVQGGTRQDPKRVLPPIAHEPTSQTGLSHVEGTVSMARYLPGTADGDFFIIVGGMPSLDARPRIAGDNAGFAAFGHVVEGMDVVRTILGSPASPTEGEGVMKGQMLDPTIKIVSARRLK
jgi:peptidyl-prolyl cis-trans isomerase A (cyclophilin A)